MIVLRKYHIKNYYFLRFHKYPTSPAPIMTPFLPSAVT